MTALPGRAALPGNWAENVSRETFQRLEIFETLLVKWNRTVNLVAPSTVPHLWERHFLDSAQLLDCAPAALRWLDIGSGAGFPGLVLAILAAESRPDADFTLMEASAKKCEFLRCAVRETGIQASVLETRCETAQPQQAGAVTARAVAPLPRLLDLAAPHLSKGGILIFPKGRERAAEIREARRKWAFDLRERPSITDSAAAILVIRRPIRD